MSPRGVTLTRYPSFFTRILKRLLKPGLMKRQHVKADTPGATDVNPRS